MSIHTRIDIHFDEHPSHAEMELEHLGLQVCAVSYCNRNLTDGFVSDRAVRGFGKSGKAPKVAVQMVKLGKWERIEGGYQIVGFLDWNPSKVEVLARRAAKAAAGQLGGQRSGESRSKHQAPAEAPASTLLRPLANPSPSPSPAPEKKKKPLVSKKSGWPNGFDPVTSCAEWLKNKGVSRRDAEAQAELFRLFCDKESKTYANWNAAFQHWICNAIGYGNLEVSPETKVVPMPKRLEESGPDVAISDAEYNQLFDGIVRTGHAS